MEDQDLIVQQQPTRRVHKTSRLSKRGDFMAVDPKDQAFSMFTNEEVPGTEVMAKGKKFRIQLCDQKQNLNYYRISTLQEEKANVEVPKVDKQQLEKQRKHKERQLQMRTMRKEAEKNVELNKSAFASRNNSKGNSSSVRNVSSRTKPVLTRNQTYQSDNVITHRVSRSMNFNNSNNRSSSSSEKSNNDKKDRRISNESQRSRSADSNLRKRGSNQSNHSNRLKP